MKETSYKGLIVHVYEMSRKDKSTETESGLWLPRTGQMEDGEECLIGMRLPSRVRNVLKLIVVIDK